MPFNSFNFWLLFPFLFVIYWAIPSKYNNVRIYFLIFISYFLYMLWQPSFAIILFYVTIVTYLGALSLSKNNRKRRSTLCMFFLILGLLPLLIFKYYDFINNNINDILIYNGLNFTLSGLNWTIPIGISFFTFQAVGYMIDVFRNRIPVEKNFAYYTLFVSFFPQVTSGPISKSVELLPQIKHPSIFNYEQAKQGLKLLLWGMFIKLVVADRLGLFVDTIYSNYENYSGMLCFIASIFYTIQIYGDFAGYSFMAIGIAKTMGFNLVNNFQRPYLAKSVTEFWKRWHISLTRWLTTYVYIELGGNRCSNIRQYINIMITFLVSGLWHGANWTFVIWGGIHGFLQVLEKCFFGESIKKEIRENRNFKLINIPRMLVTLLCVNVAWVFFRMPSIKDSCEILLKMFSFSGDSNFVSIMGTPSSICAVLGISVLVFKDLKDEFFLTKLKFLTYKPFRWFIYVFIFVMILSCGVLDGGQFIYANF